MVSISEVANSGGCQKRAKFFDNSPRMWYTICFDNCESNPQVWIPKPGRKKNQEDIVLVAEFAAVANAPEWRFL